MKYVLAIDQSTQGTKALLLDGLGKIISRTYKTHRQIIDRHGYISHDANEIWDNVLYVARECIGNAKINRDDLAAIGISNQRETSCIWNDEGALSPAVVWQCARGKEISDALIEHAEEIRTRTGLPLSPYFPAAKFAWLLQHVSREGPVRLGTIDSWLVWKLTGNFYTDFSNASRTQLFNLHTLRWDEDLCALFGVSISSLPEVKDSDADFGRTTLGGFLPKPVPVRAVLGDSHAALFAQGCDRAGQLKVTYGTGSSVMMNVGEKYKESKVGLATSLAWKIGGKVFYVLEGNINYSCAVITWLKELGLISEAKEAGEFAAKANPQDTTVLVPAFSGLSAPYWKPNAKAAIVGMTRTTGKSELCKAAEESIVFQIADVVDRMREDTGLPVLFIRADGEAASDRFLMQTQADFAGVEMYVPDTRELSAVGVGCLAGISAGVFGNNVLDNIGYTKYEPKANARDVKSKRARWIRGVAQSVEEE